MPARIRTHPIRPREILDKDNGYTSVPLHSPLSIKRVFSLPSPSFLYTHYRLHALKDEAEAFHSTRGVVLLDFRTSSREGRKVEQWKNAGIRSCFPANSCCLTKREGVKNDPSVPSPPKRPHLSGRFSSRDLVRGNIRSHRIRERCFSDHFFTFAEIPRQMNSRGEKEEAGRARDKKKPRSKVNSCEAQDAVGIETAFDSILDLYARDFLLFLLATSFIRDIGPTVPGEPAFSFSHFPFSPWIESDRVSKSCNLGLFEIPAIRKFSRRYDINRGKWSRQVFCISAIAPLMIRFSRRDII